jgi:hypothetical protein
MPATVVEILCVALVVSGIPARRAWKVEQSRALRHEQAASRTQMSAICAKCRKETLPAGNSRIFHRLFHDPVNKFQLFPEAGIDLHALI